MEETWLEALPSELQKPYAKTLSKFVENEICGGAFPIYPPTHLIFNALNSTPFDRVKAVILGQDPYHGPGQAMGLSFSVPEGVKVPSSLVNIFKELHHDLGCSIPSHGNLEKWAVQVFFIIIFLLHYASLSFFSVSCELLLMFIFTFDSISRVFSCSMLFSLVSSYIVHVFLMLVLDFTTKGLILLVQHGSKVDSLFTNANRFSYLSPHFSQ